MGGTKAADEDVGGGGLYAGGGALYIGPWQEMALGRALEALKK